MVVSQKLSVLTTANGIVPDNQAIIIVGDVDVNHIEAKIKELFSGIKVPKNAAKIEKVEVSDNDSAIYVIDKDKSSRLISSRFI